jgi:hypothetical protein
MEKVYVVKSDNGEYDDWSWRIEGIFTDPAKAEELAVKIKDKIKECLDRPCPFTQEQVQSNQLTEAECDSYYSWYNERYEAERFNDCKVKEYPLNTPLP